MVDKKGMVDVKVKMVAFAVDMIGLKAHSQLLDSRMKAFASSPAEMFTALSFQLG